MGKQQVVTIPYTPRSYFLPIHETKKRWIVVVAHRRSGKTTMALNHLQRDALLIPNSKFGFIAPTYKQAKNIAWEMIKNYARPIPNVEFNEVELAVKYPNGYAIWIGTPQGKNEFYNLFEQAKADESWQAILLDTDGTKIISQEELA